MSDVHLPNGKTQLIGMFASPVRTTWSPAIHNLGFRLLDLDLCYLAFDVDEDSLENAMNAVRTLHMRGCSIAKPHKTDVIPYLDDITETAQLIGSVNVVENKTGRLIGHNTDGRGYIDCLKELGIPYAGSKITVVGAGGTASAVEVTLAMSGVREVAIFNAKDSFFERAEETVETINRFTDCHAALYDLADEEELARQTADSLILANATDVGHNEDETWLKDASILRRDLIVTDTIYNPAKTKLLRLAEAQGCRIINGAGMMAWQAAEAFRIWTGKEMPVAEIRSRLGF